MKKYNTKPIDYTGCHPVIAEALKRGEAIECEVWDSDCDKEQEIEVWVCRYCGNSSLPYSPDFDMSWKHAEPIPLKVKRIMPPERAIPVLIAEGWEFYEDGRLICPGEGSIFASLLCLMGKSLDDPEVSAWKWPSCIIEEVEDDE